MIYRPMTIVEFKDFGDWVAKRKVDYDWWNVADCMMDDTAMAEIGMSNNDWACWDAYLERKLV